MFMIGFQKDLVSTFWRFVRNESRKSVINGSVKPKTCGIIVTGDEVLKGQVLDTNSYFLCKQLYSMGIQVLAVSKVGDDINIIADEVQKFSQKYDYVLTTGGIGPTHDDVTYEAIAKAFNYKLHYHPQLSNLVLQFYKTNELNHPALKMAYIPTMAKLTYGFDVTLQKKAFYPVVTVENIYIYPGVPYLCKRLFNFTKNILFPSCGKFYLREMYLTQNESLIVKELNDAVTKFANVSFGSYPKFFHSYYSVKITLQSTDQDEVNKAYEYLRNLIPDEYHIDYEDDPYSDKMKKISRFKDEYFLKTVQMLEALFASKAKSDEIFLYFDGGKNSTVLLYIVSAFFEKYFPQSQINIIYVERNPEARKFVDECVSSFKLNLLKLKENHLRNFLNSNRDLCIIKGVRKTDPKFETLEKNLENVNVVNPMYNWSYKNVWHVIRSLYLPYCQLYDQGYTTINQINAGPNPHLRIIGPRPDLVYYKKAFELEDESLEYVV